MAAGNDVRKNFNVFVDGRGYAGDAEEFNAPKLSLKVEEFRAAGMNVPVDLDMGQEKMETDFSLVSYSKDVLALFGLAAGNTVPLVVREALESFDGTVTPVIHTMRGRIKEVDSGTSKAGDKPTQKFTLSLTYYKLQHGSTVVQEIDAINMVHIVNGVDQMAAQRSALGMYAQELISSAGRSMSITKNADGSVDIALTKAITIGGASVKALRMREPTVGDQLAASRAGDKPEDQELAMVANLCQMAPADLHQLSLKDYKKVQAAFVGFLD